MKVKSLSKCPTLRDPMDCSLPGSPVHGIFQARVLEWGAIAFSPVSSVTELKQALCFQSSVGLSSNLSRSLDCGPHWDCSAWPVLHSPVPGLLTNVLVQRCLETISTWRITRLKEYLLLYHTTFLDGPINLATELTEVAPGRSLGYANTPSAQHLQANQKHPDGSSCVPGTLLCT